MGSFNTEEISETTDGGLTRSVIGSPESGNWVTPLATDAAGNVYAGYSQLYQLQNDFG